MVAHAQDPLGKRPKPLTGRWSADFADPLVQARFAVINGVLDQIWVSHPPQEDVVGKILAYRLSKLGKSQGPMDGLCLAQGSQMGKTATALRVKHQLAIQATAAGHAAHEFHVIIVGLDQKTSLKSVYQELRRGSRSRADNCRRVSAPTEGWRRCFRCHGCSQATARSRARTSGSDWQRAS